MALPPGVEGSLGGGRYAIQSCLGQGGMGVVYKAYDRVLEETVAIKVLLGRAGADPGAARRFRSEIKLARKVTHHNVCRIHDYGEDGGRPYISMQFVEGADLRTRVRGGDGLHAAEAVDVALQIADGLQAIHDEGIVHRDLKTANVMIDSRGVVRLMDFGIAKKTDGGEALTGTGHIVGTPEYMSPEQIHGQPLDARSDVYSLGIILFELFTGRVPFGAGTTMGVLMKHLHEDPPVEEPVAAAIPPRVRAIIRKALAKDRNDRHGSARELARDLRDARTSAVVSRTPPTDEATLTRPPPSPAWAPGSRTAAVSAGGSPPARNDSRADVSAPPTRRWVRPLGGLGLVVVVALGFWISHLGDRPALPAQSPSPAPPSAPVPATTSPRGQTISPGEPVPRAGSVVPTPSVPPATFADATRACESGQATACVSAGQRLETGDGVLRDARRGAALYRRACDLGAANGCTRLGLLHNSGVGVEKDVARAAELYQKACSGSHGPGCNNLGTMYEFGVIGFDADVVRAAGYYRRACDLGDASGCANLAIVSLDDPNLSGSQREEALRVLRQGCSSNLPRTCRKLQDLGLVR